jgi:hypothetical protein
VADTAAKADSEPEAVTSSIAAAAEKYESEHSPPKKNLAEIHVMTGEEDERNVIQVRMAKYEHLMYQPPPPLSIPYFKIYIRRYVPL